MKQRRAHAILVQGTIHFLSFITPIKKQINKQTKKPHGHYVSVWIRRQADDWQKHHLSFLNKAIHFSEGFFFFFTVYFILSKVAVIAIRHVSINCQLVLINWELVYAVFLSVHTRPLWCQPQQRWAEQFWGCGESVYVVLDTSGQSLLGSWTSLHPCPLHWHTERRKNIPSSWMP